MRSTAKVAAGVVTVLSKIDAISVNVPEVVGKGFVRLRSKGPIMVRVNLHLSR